MLKFFFYICFLQYNFSQSDVKELPPDKGVEFKLNSLSGKVIDEKHK